jgi:aldose 1-epimerase
MDITKELFGKTSDGIEVSLYTLKNDNQMSVKISTYGATITSVKVPDINGETGDVVLGFNSYIPYLNGHPYIGVIVGRYGNRIANGKFTLNGKTYALATNNGPNHLHGGVTGFDKVVWNADVLKDSSGPGLRLSYLSKDGEEGYPGNLTISVTFSITNDNELKISYEANTDQATPVNLTSHAYFNLSAGKSENALKHELTLFADRYTPVDATLIPTGVIDSVKNAPSMDFTEPKAIGSDIGQVTGGYDHNYVVNRTDNSLAHAAYVLDPASGRTMNVYTTEPGVQFYSGNFLDGTLVGKENKAYVQHYGFCLETQHFPDSPNQPNFPDTILHPGQIFKSQTIYVFGVKK